VPVGARSLVGVTAAEGYRELGEAAWSWVLEQVRGDDGPWLPVAVPDSGAPAVPTADRDSLYDGIAGLAPLLAEIAAYRPLRGDEQALADAVVDRLATQAESRTEASLYDGLAGDVTALRMLAPGRESVPMRRLAELSTPAGWPTAQRVDPEIDGPISDLVMGTAGVVLAGLWAGGEHASAVATTGCEALLGAADRTPAGLDWGMVPHARSRGPNFSHGTAGIGAALAVAGVALDRSDFIDAAVAGARHLLTVGSLADGGFVVPHTIPPARREVEPVTYTWCHGPAGTSYLFTALREAGVEEVSGHAVDDLRRRCLYSVQTSGVPQRLRPGFWDNDGRCCGTAGVGDVLLDAAQDEGDPARADELLDAAVTMADALVERAVRDDSGARWRFVEHRIEVPLLPPGTSWMQGAAGIAAFLLRLARVLTDGREAPVVDRPDQWWAVPARLRTVHVAP
jgi:lantibiotic modifying enzyme